jgi:hypothetical protein
LWARTIIAIYTGKSLIVKPEIDKMLKRAKRSLLLKIETLNIVTTMQEGIFSIAVATDPSLSLGERNELLTRAKGCGDRLQKSHAAWGVAQSQLMLGCIAAAHSEPERACIIW